MRTTRRRTNLAAPTAAAAFLLLALGLWCPAEVRAQWTTDANQRTTTTDKVGVGTTTPETSVEVRKDTAGDLGPIISLSNGLGGQHAGGAIDFTIPGWSIPQARIRSLDNNDWSANLGFFTKIPGASSNALAERMRITSAGNVGIGSINPTAQLHVDRSQNSNTAIFVSNNGAGVSALATIRAGLNPSDYSLDQISLTVLGANWGTGAGGDFLKGKSTLLESSGSNLGIGNLNNTEPIIFYTTAARAERMRINADGGVGIGTSPGAAYKLEVAGSVKATGFCLGVVCKTDWSEIGGSQWAPVGSSGAITYGSGNVGIGAPSPVEKLHVNGGLVVTGASTLPTGVNGLFLGIDGTEAAIRAIQQGTDFRNLSMISKTFSVSTWNGSALVQGIYQGNTGNVGVGTTAPAVKLAVGGNGINVYGTDAWIQNNLHVQGSESLAGNTDKGRLRVGSAWGYSGLYADVSSVGRNNDLVLGASSGTIRVGPGATAAMNLSVPNGDISASGSITGGTISATYQDVAEWVPSIQKLSAGTVVVLDSARTNHVLASSAAYDTKVAGVVSAEPGVILGVAGEGKVKVATTGRVKVKVDASRAPIRIGDLIVTSDVEGMAMRSEPVTLGGRQMHAPGTIIGKALEPLEKGVGEILVLLSLQ